MHLLVGIDTEGDNQWDAAARANQTFENIYALPRAARAVRAPRRPADLRRHPPGRHRSARRPKCCARSSLGGDCEIGAHHHAWETPPCTPEDVAPPRRTRRRCRATSSIAQLASLTAAITAAVGRRAGVLSFRPLRLLRGSRRGARAARLPASSRASRRCSTRPHKGGPEFVEAPLRPYFLAYDNASRPGTSNLLEVPVSAALNRRLPAWSSHAYARAPEPYMTKRMLRALGIARMRWLRPSYSSLADMISLARDLVAGRRADAESAVPLERGDRRRQPVQSHAIGARRVLRPAGAVPRPGHDRARRQARDLRRVPRRLLRNARERRPTATHAYPPRHAAPAAGSGRQRAAALAARDVGPRGG